MKLRNIGGAHFEFEGVVIPAGEVSEELEPTVAQRLLAIYWNAPLLPIDAEQIPLVEGAVEVVHAPVVVKEDDTKVDCPFVCDICQKAFSKKIALAGHHRAHTKK